MSLSLSYTDRATRLLCSHPNLDAKESFSGCMGTSRTWSCCAWKHSDGCSQQQDQWSHAVVSKRARQREKDTGGPQRNCESSAPRCNFGETSGTDEDSDSQGGEQQRWLLKKQQVSTNLLFSKPRERACRSDACIPELRTVVTSVLTSYRNTPSEQTPRNNMRQGASRSDCAFSGSTTRACRSHAQKKNTSSAIDLRLPETEHSHDHAALHPHRNDRKTSAMDMSRKKKVTRRISRTGTLVVLTSARPSSKWKYLYRPVAIVNKRSMANKREELPNPDAKN